MIELEFVANLSGTPFLVSFSPEASPEEDIESLLDQVLPQPKTKHSFGYDTADDFVDSARVILLDEDEPDPALFRCVNTDDRYRLNELNECRDSIRHEQRLNREWDARKLLHRSLKGYTEQPSANPHLVQFARDCDRILTSVAVLMNGENLSQLPTPLLTAWAECDQLLSVKVPPTPSCNVTSPQTPSTGHHHHHDTAVSSEAAEPSAPVASSAPVFAPPSPEIKLSASTLRRLLAVCVDSRLCMLYALDPAESAADINALSPADTDLLSPAEPTTAALSSESSDLTTSPVADTSDDDEENGEGQPPWSVSQIRQQFTRHQSKLRSIERQQSQQWKSAQTRRMQASKLLPQLLQSANDSAHQLFPLFLQCLHTISVWCQLDALRYLQCVRCLFAPCLESLYTNSQQTLASLEEIATQSQQFVDSDSFLTLRRVVALLPADLAQTGMDSIPHEAFQHPSTGITDCHVSILIVRSPLPPSCSLTHTHIFFSANPVDFQWLHHTLPIGFWHRFRDDKTNPHVTTETLYAQIRKLYSVDSEIDEESPFHAPSPCQEVPGSDTLDRWITRVFGELKSADGEASVTVATVAGTGLPESLVVPCSIPIQSEDTKTTPPLMLASAENVQIRRQRRPSDVDSQAMQWCAELRFLHRHARFLTLYACAIKVSAFLRTLLSTGGISDSCTVDEDDVALFEQFLSAQFIAPQLATFDSKSLSLSKLVQVDRAEPVKFADVVVETHRALEDALPMLADNLNLIITRTAPKPWSSGLALTATEPTIAQLRLAARAAKADSPKSNPVSKHVQNQDTQSIQPVFTATKRKRSLPDDDDLTIAELRVKLAERKARLQAQRAAARERTRLKKEAADAMASATLADTCVITADFQECVPSLPAL